MRENKDGRLCEVTWFRLAFWFVDSATADDQSFRTVFNAIWKITRLRRPSSLPVNTNCWFFFFLLFSSKTTLLYFQLLITVTKEKRNSHLKGEDKVRKEKKIPLELPLQCMLSLCDWFRCLVSGQNPTAYSTYWETSRVFHVSTHRVWTDEN